jgi:hypothetical protein
MARKASRTFGVGVWSTKENRWIPAGLPVPLDHLSDEDYEKLNGLYPEEATAAEQKRAAEEAAAKSPNLNRVKE